MKKRDYFWALIIGIILAVVGFAAAFFPSVNNTAREFPLSLTYCFWIEVFMTCIATPVYEEVACRFWTIGKKYAYAVSIVLQIKMSWYSFNWIVAVIVATINIVCVAVLKGSTLRCVMLVLTSILSGLIHLPTFTTITWMIVFDLMFFIGVGLVLAYVALNYAFVWAIALHCAWNSLMVLIGMLLWWNTEIPQIETEQYKVEISHYMGNTAMDPIQKYGGDTVVLHGTIPEMVDYLLLLQDMADTSFDRVLSPTLYESDLSNGLSYKAAIVNKVEGTVDYMSIIKEMVRLDLVKSDTTYENMYLLKVEDAEKLNDMYDSNSVFTIRDMVDYMRNILHLPMLPEPGLNVSFPIRHDFREMESRSKDYDTFVRYLTDVYGIKVERQEWERLQVVRFS